MLEYDLEIKPMKLIKGQGLAKLMAQPNLCALDIKLVLEMSKEEDKGFMVPISDIFLQSPWYSDILYVLQHLSPPTGMSKSNGRSLKIKSAKYCILNNTLYWKDPGGVMLNCLVEEEAQKVMHDFRKGDYGGHLFWKTTANKVLSAGYYCPTLFSDLY